MEVALEMGVERFVFTSSIVTIGLNPSGVASETDEFNWEDQAPPYVMTRVEAERQLLRLCREGLPGIVCNVATTFGGHDHQPTPHGELLKLTVAGRMPAYWDTKMSVVGVRDAADAMLLAEQHGRVGERYIVADRMMDIAEATSKTATFAGVKPPRFEIPMWGRDREHLGRREAHARLGQGHGGDHEQHPSSAHHGRLRQQQSEKRAWLGTTTHG